MRNRIAAVILAITVIFTGGAASVRASGFVSLIIDELLEYTAEDRTNMFTLVKGMIASDSGVDYIAEAVQSYQPGDSGLLSPMIASLLRNVDKDDAVSYVSKLKIASEELRGKYLTAFDSREELGLSAEAARALNYFIDKACGEYSGMTQLMTEDCVTTGVVAYMLKIVAEMNGGKPLFTDASSQNGNFAVHTISGTLKQGVDNVLVESGENSAAPFIAEYIANLNSKLSAEEKGMFRVLGSELNFYRAKKEIISREFNESSFEVSDTDEISVSRVEDTSAFAGLALEDAEVIEIALYRNGVKQTEFDGDYTVSLPVQYSSAMAYRLTDRLEPMKYSVHSDGRLYIRTDKPGYFAVKDMEKHFTDSDGWGGEYIENLYNRGIISGKGEKIFMPEDNITREEFVKLIVELFDYNDSTYYTNFTDVNHDEWYYPYVAIAYKNNLINGIGSNLFGVGQNILRMDICKIIGSVMDAKGMKPAALHGEPSFNDGEQIADYALQSVTDMYKYGVVSGYDDGYFYPGNNATRQEAAKIIHGILELYVKGARF